MCKTIDLFAGIGGIRIGFEKIGFETVFANDFDKYCKPTYDLNFNGTKLTIRDIKTIKSKSLPDFNFLLVVFHVKLFQLPGIGTALKTKTEAIYFLKLQEFLMKKTNGFFA